MAGSDWRWFTRPERDRRAPAGRGVFARLRSDVRGNTLAIMAAALIPLAGMVGGGMDITRMYITKTRLQHACDAGALAGRRSMGAGNWASEDETLANRFFDANYQVGAYGSTTLIRRFTENSGKVTGTASAVLPMTLMRVLGKTSDTLAVSCDAQLQLPNTDVMFVLDTTGSMNCKAGDTSCTNNGGTPATDSKIGGLKTAVKCFYESVAQLDTNAACTGTPSGGTSAAVQVRFGFVPYASNVNVGYLLPSNYFANSWTYQSRDRTGSAAAWSDWADRTDYNVRAGNGACNPPANTSTRQYQYDSQVSAGGTVYCLYDSRFYGPQWNYKPVSIPLTALKNGTGWNRSFTLPINDDASSRTITWDGCIEERPTVRQSSYTPIPANAYDLNIDLVPSASANSLWGPALNDVIFYRNMRVYPGGNLPNGYYGYIGYLINNDSSGASTANSVSANNYYNKVSYSCPTEAKKLQEWPSAADFSSYVDGLVASGNTYHDIGMLWGARFMSPTGIFASENAVANNGGTIQRHMIFMTDGDATSSPCDYNAYGVPWYDQRQSTDVGAAADCFSNRQALIDQINARLVSICTEVKNKGITLWVVSYGGGVNSTTEARLKTCASDPDSVAPTHYFSADDPDKLQTTFATIANNISQLRLTK